ncbi:MAG: hypothetical protein J0H45_11190, partial [Stenotrophomonas nitritireducens]|nr:hypothetical protein [Stenotrophomonas nitritireducens]
MPPAVDATEARAVAMLLRLLLAVAGYQLLTLLWSPPSAGLPGQALTVCGMLTCLVSLELLRRRRLLQQRHLCGQQHGDRRSRRLEFRRHSEGARRLR